MIDPARRPLDVSELTSEEVWRVGYRPDPWCWVDWRWSTGGKFNGRWDDAEGRFRTVYAGQSFLACLVELPACFRPDPALVLEMTAIDEDDEDAVLFPTATVGRLPESWLDPRVAGVARLNGHYVQITTTNTIAALHPDFVGQALRLGLGDFDAAALKDSRARPLTQAVSTAMYELALVTGDELDGIEFASRHGDDLKLWAIFERPGDPEVSPRLTDLNLVTLHVTHPDLVAAMDLLDLEWATI